MFFVQRHLGRIKIRRPLRVIAESVVIVLTHQINIVEATMTTTFQALVLKVKQESHNFKAWIANQPRRDGTPAPLDGDERSLQRSLPSGFKPFQTKSESPPAAGESSPYPSSSNSSSTNLLELSDALMSVTARRNAAVNRLEELKTTYLSLPQESALCENSLLSRSPDLENTPIGIMLDVVHSVLSGVTRAIGERNVEWAWCKIRCAEKMLELVEGMIGKFEEKVDRIVEEYEF